MKTATKEKLTYNDRIHIERAELVNAIIARRPTLSRELLMTEAKANGNMKLYEILDILKKADLITQMFALAIG